MIPSLAATRAFASRSFTFQAWPLTLALLCPLVTPSCVSTATSAESQGRAIDDIPTLEALPVDARPWIKVSVRQDGGDEVPEQFRWIMALRNQDGSVASGENLESKIVGALQASNRFRVRTNNFDDFHQEAELEEAGYLRDDTPVNRGRVARAQYAIRANVTDMNFGEEESGSSLSIPLPFIGRQSLGKKKKVATITISAEIVNLETGEHVQYVEAKGRQTSGSSAATFRVRGIRLSQEEKKNPTLANAITECIKELVYEIGESIPPKRYEQGVRIGKSSRAARCAGSRRTAERCRCQNSTECGVNEPSRARLAHSAQRPGSSP